MDIRKVKKLIELLQESGIAELEISEGEESVRISRYPPGGAVQHYAVADDGNRDARVPRCNLQKGAHAARLHLGEVLTPGHADGLQRRAANV